MKDVVYRGVILAKNSDAYRMWEEWQRAKSDRNKYQDRLDKHLKQLDVNTRELMTRYDR